jgi:hypothetical protein
LPLLDATDTADQNRRVPASSFSSHTSDLDEARALCHRYYYPITLDPLRGNSRLAFSFRVMELGPVTIGEPIPGRGH